MDSFRGSLPPIFISFRLVNQTPENDAVTSSPVTSPPASAEITISDPQTVADLLNSPRSADSEKDSDAKVQSMKSDGLSSNAGLAALADETLLGIQIEEMASQGLPQITTLRSSTPIPVTDEWAARTILAAVESGLRFVDTSASQLPELLHARSQNPEGTTATVVQTDDDNNSSVYEVPALPSGDPEVRFLTDLSESEKTVEESSNTGHQQLYRNIPNMSESGIEAGDESTSQAAGPSHQDYTATISRGMEDNLPEISGRTRAILKTYFDEANSAFHSGFYRATSKPSFTDPHR